MKVGAAAFIPDFVVGGFGAGPSIGEAFEQGPAKKKKQLTKEEIEAKKKAELEALSTKGKPEQFFYWGPNGELN